MVPHSKNLGGERYKTGWALSQAQWAGKLAVLTGSGTARTTGFFNSKGLKCRRREQRLPRPPIYPSPAN